METSTETVTDEGSTLGGRRVLVVGSSAGLGRVVGRHLSRLGAHVAFAARRGELCEEAAREASPNAIGLTCDVTDPAMCEQVVRDTVERLGGLDDLVYATGLIAMVALADADATWWRSTFETNVMGAALVTRAALPELKRSGGTAVFMSSVASFTGPWPGIGVYSSTKAALNWMVQSWRAEHPDVGFARVNIGPTADGATGAQMDPGMLPHMERWAGMGIASGAMADSASIARAVELILRDPARVWDVTVQPRDPALPWPPQTMEP